MQEIIEDVLALARTGTIVEALERLELASVARTAWQTVATNDATLDINDDNQVYFCADQTRVIELFENLFRNAVEHAGTDITIQVGPLPDGEGFYIEDDGPGTPADNRETVFEYGFTTSDEGTGFGLAIVQGIAEAHEWEVTITEGSMGGTRIEVHGVVLDDDDQIPNKSSE